MNESIQFILETFKYKDGSPFCAKNHSEAEMKQKDFLIKLYNPRDGRINEKNIMWKGDEVGYAGLHRWVKGVSQNQNYA